MFIAEREGFEPPEPFSSTVFKTAVIDHSTTSPIFQRCGTDRHVPSPERLINQHCLPKGSAKVTKNLFGTNFL